MANANKWSHISDLPPKEWGEYERSQYTDWASRQIQIDSFKGAGIIGVTGNAALLATHRFHPGFRAKDWRLKLLFSIGFPLIGYAVWGDEAVTQYARHPPWGPQPGEYRRLA